MCVQIRDFAVFVFRIFVIMQQVIFLYATLCIFHIQVESVILEIPYYSLNSDTALSAELSWSWLFHDHYTLSHQIPLGRNEINFKILTTNLIFFDFFSGTTPVYISTNRSNGDYSNQNFQLMASPWNTQVFGMLCENREYQSTLGPACSK